MAERQTYRLGIDIGGTFTDLVLVGSDGSVRTGKLASTPDDYGRAIVEGVAALLESAGVAPGQVESVVHATTVATNAVLEQSGARTALITTAGFRDVLEMRRLRIPRCTTCNTRNRRRWCRAGSVARSTSAWARTARSGARSTRTGCASWA